MLTFLDKRLFSKRAVPLALLFAAIELLVIRLTSPAESIGPTEAGSFTVPVLLALVPKPVVPAPVSGPPAPLNELVTPLATFAGATVPVVSIHSLRGNY